MPPKAGRLAVIAAGLAGATGASSPEIAAVLMEDGRIKAMGEEALASTAPLLDLRPAWLAPAPLDAHTHLWLRGEPTANLAACRQAGLAAVRDLGNPPKRERPRGDATEPPLLIASGPGLCAQGAAKTWLGLPCAGPREFAQAARGLIASGVGLLKVFVTGLLDFNQPGQVEHPLAVSQEELAAVAVMAKKAGLKLAVHASGITAARACLAAGVDSLEHGFFLDRETLELMARKDLAWSPTLAAVEAHAADPEGRHNAAIRRNLELIAEGQAQAMRQAEELGVNLVLGTDAGSYGLPHGQAVFLEMEAWQRAGLKPETVFQAATSRAARLLGLEGEVGRIAVGARAWLMATAQDPRREPLALAKPLWRSF